jgi:hypothetical protein
VDNLWITCEQIFFRKIQKNAKKLTNSPKNLKKREKARKSPEKAKNRILSLWRGFVTNKQKMTFFRPDGSRGLHTLPIYRILVARQ